MRRIPLARRWSFLVALAAIACGPEVTVVGVDGTSTTGSQSDTTAAGSSSGATEGDSSGHIESSSVTGMQPVCTPRETRCSEGGELETCDGEGGWSTEACPDGTACVPCNEDECIGAACLSPCESNELSSRGCSFIVSRQLGLAEVIGPSLDIPQEQWPVDGLLLVNPGDDTASVEVFELGAGENEPGRPSQSLTLQPGTGQVVPIADALPIGFNTTLRIGSMAWVVSDRPISAHAYNPLEPFVGNDSSMMLPERALGRHYVVPSFPPHYLQFQGAGTPTYFDVIATAPNTEVRWRSDFAPTWDASIPNELVPIGTWSETYALSRFSGIRVVPAGSRLADPHDADMSGAVIEASQPVYVVGGSRCSAVPEFDAANRGCDPLTEALVPLEQWGTTYAVPAPPPRDQEDHHFRVYASEAGVTVSTDPPGLGIDDYTFTARGEYVDLVVPFGTSFAATGTGPIMVVGYLASRDLAGGIGDPAMYQLVPAEQGDREFLGIEGRTKNVAEAAQDKENKAPGRRQKRQGQGTQKRQRRQESAHQR